MGSHAQCFLCRSVSWSDLSWSLWCSSLPILCSCPQPPHQPPRWAPRSLYLNPADSNKHIHHCCFLPSRWTAVKTKALWRSCYNETVSWSSVKASGYLCKHLVSWANAVKMKKSTHKSTDLKVFSVQGSRPTHLCWLSLTFMLTLAPSRCCRSRTP